jgi:hypothetical protein
MRAPIDDISFVLQRFVVFLVVPHLNEICYINSEDQIISKTYMTRVEGENTRLRHYFARLHRKTVWYSKSEQMLRYSIRGVAG